MQQLITTCVSLDNSVAVHSFIKIYVIHNASSCESNLSVDVSILWSSLVQIPANDIARCHH